MGEILYPATAFEQSVLKAVKELNGEGHPELITQKVREAGKSNPRLEPVRSTLQMLESMGYVSSSSSQGNSGKARTTYRIEALGERALASAPFRRLEPAALQKRAILAVLAFYAEYVNSSFLQIAWLNRLLIFIVCLATAWLLVGIVQMYRVAQIYKNVPSAQTNENRRRE